MTAALVALVVGNLVLAAALGFALATGARERARLINAALARSPAEFVQLQRADTKAKAERPEPRPIQVGA